MIVFNRYQKAHLLFLAKSKSPLPTLRCSMFKKLMARSRGIFYVYKTFMECHNISAPWNHHLWKYISKHVATRTGWTPSLSSSRWHGSPFLPSLANSKSRFLSLRDLTFTVILYPLSRVQKAASSSLTALSVSCSKFAQNHALQLFDLDSVWYLMFHNEGDPTDANLISLEFRIKDLHSGIQD